MCASGDRRKQDLIEDCGSQSGVFLAPVALGVSISAVEEGESEE